MTQHPHPKVESIENQIEKLQDRHSRACQGAVAEARIMTHRYVSELHKVMGPLADIPEFAEACKRAKTVKELTSGPASDEEVDWDSVREKLSDIPHLVHEASWDEYED